MKLLIVLLLLTASTACAKRKCYEAKCKIVCDGKTCKQVCEKVCK